MFDGSEKKFRKATAFIETPFFTGKVTALVLANPVVDVILGNIIGVGDQPNLNEQSPTWKDDPDSDHKAHAYVSTRAQKSTADYVNPNNSGDNKQAEKNENTSYKTAVSEFKREDLEKEQQSDPTLETVRAKAKNNNETCYTYNGIIFRRTNDKSDIDQIVLPKSMRQEVLQACHDSPIAGHLGINATKKRVCSRFSWPSIVRDVTKYVKSCDVCKKNCNKLPNLPIQIADIIDKPFDKVAIDIVGPMMMPDSKNRFILTLVDAATRWPEADPLKSISTTDVANALFNIFTRLGVPKEILSDNSQQLVSKAMEEVMTMMGIQRRLSTPYHAQSNEMVERFNGSLKTMLRKLCAEKRQTWDKMIPAVLFAYREIPNVTTGYPPFMLMYGRRVRGPADMTADQYIGQQNTLKEAAFVHEYAKNLQREITDSCKIAAETAKNQLQSYREAKSDHRRYREFAKGDKVLILLPQDGNNLFVKYQGPYKIDGVAQNNNYIFTMRNGKRTYHANILKKYEEREPSPPLQAVVENACTGIASTGTASNGDVRRARQTTTSSV
ncbi:gypsy retrotransposon integrase-like protein 1 [Plakobranchus ocellatus]|uniref:Gypsy retrotransposon integrase-like protein 1 n=1 Tax=Plakobranchus ocellatus TaxID=259542 RepID=A0AAV3ZM59_9GAST|nr:gypsy retrotransposon integrase-like protein 1 [Plakobranchus ocellatus]